MRGLRVDRDGRTVLPGITLDVPAGVVSGLLGPSGCGKTTLMRAIVGVQRVAGGTITVLGAPAGSAALRRRVAYMTQTPSVYGDLTVRENLRYFADILESRENIDDVVATVDLRERLSSLVRDLSGGESSRVSLAVALLGSPDLLVLDEPTVGLDPVLRRDLWATFHRLAEDGKSLLVSTHVMDEAERCDHLLLMRDGRILAAGSPQELRGDTPGATLESAFLTLAGAA